MIEHDSTQSVPLMPPHYKLLSHPLVHDPSSHSYIDCQDILENAVCLLGLFHNLEFEEDGNRGALSADAAGAFYCLIVMLEDTLRYVSENLDDAWRKREDPCLERKLQQSVFFKALKKPTESDKAHIYSIIASCLGIGSTDIETFIGMAEELKDTAPDAKKHNP